MNHPSGISSPFPNPEDSSQQSTANFRAARDLLLLHRTDQLRASAAFTWPDVGDSFNWATDWFDVIAKDNSRIALWIVEQDGSEQKITFDEMSRRSDQVATWFTDLGVRSGDHVMLMLGNQVELWEAMLAILKIGAVILPTSEMLGTADLDDRVRRGDVAHVIVNAHDVGKFDDVSGEFGRIAVGPVDGSAEGSTPEGWVSFADSVGVVARPVEHTASSSDPSLIYFTSGTTSKPKMVLHSELSYPVGHLSTMYWLGVKPGDIHLAISSPGWGKHAWSCFFAPWIAEATVFVYNYGRFDPAALVQQMHRVGVTTFCAPPTVWRMLIQSSMGERPEGMRELLSAGEPLNPEVISQVQRAWGLVIRDGYGQTETTAIIGNGPGSALKAGSMGLPLPGVNVRLIDPLTGEDTEEGEVCLDLAVRPLNLMTGYYGDGERTTEATRNGLFHTGDVASRDSDGYRTDDIFKSSDYKVSPFEVESVLLEHAAVAEAAVVPAPDDTRLNIAKAYIHLAAGWEATAETASAVLRHARHSLPPYMRVRRVEFIELPKTSSGKIRRVDLREIEVKAAADGIAPPNEWRDDQFPEIRTPA
jgi:acetyl-CoA synthetase